jgi:hypothetical protein
MLGTGCHCRLAHARSGVSLPLRAPDMTKGPTNGRAPHQNYSVIRATRTHTLMRRTKPLRCLDHSIRVVVEVPDALVAACAGKTAYALTAGAVPRAASVIVIHVDGTLAFRLGVELVVAQVTDPLLCIEQPLPLVSRDPVLHVVRVPGVPPSGCFSRPLGVVLSDLPGHVSVVRTAYFRVIPVDPALLVVLPAGAALGTLPLRSRGVLEAYTPRLALLADDVADVLLHSLILYELSDRQN